MHIKNFTLLVLCILLATAPLHAQDDNNNSENNGENKEERASGWLKELLEFRIGKDAMGIYFLTNVNHPATGNAPLRDSIVSLMDSTNICFSVKDTMELDHFWSFLCNTKDYKTQKDGFSDYLEALDFDDESYVETDLYKAGYDIHFIPQWDKSQAPPKDESRKYKMKIYSKIPSGLKDDVSNTDLEQAANEPIQETTINFAGLGNHQPNKETVNKGFFAGFDYIKELNVKKEKIEYFIVRGKDTIPCKDNPDLYFSQKDTTVELSLISNNPNISFDNVNWEIDGEEASQGNTCEISLKESDNKKLKIKKEIEVSGKDYILKPGISPNIIINGTYPRYFVQVNGKEHPKISITSEQIEEIFKEVEENKGTNKKHELQFANVYYFGEKVEPQLKFYKKSGPDAELQEYKTSWRHFNSEENELHKSDGKTSDYSKIIEDQEKIMIEFSRKTHDEENESTLTFGVLAVNFLRVIPDFYYNTSFDDNTPDNLVKAKNNHLNLFGMRTVELVPKFKTVADHDRSEGKVNNSDKNLNLSKKQSKEILNIQHLKFNDAIKNADEKEKCIYDLTSYTMEEDKPKNTLTLVSKTGDHTKTFNIEMKEAPKLILTTKQIKTLGIDNYDAYKAKNMSSINYAQNYEEDKNNECIPRLTYTSLTNNSFNLRFQTSDETKINGLCKYKFEYDDNSVTIPPQGISNGKQLKVDIDIGKINEGGGYLTISDGLGNFKDKLKLVDRNKLENNEEYTFQIFKLAYQDKEGDIHKANINQSNILSYLNHAYYQLNIKWKLDDIINVQISEDEIESITRNGNTYSKERIIELLKKGGKSTSDAKDYEEILRYYFENRIKDLEQYSKEQYHVVVTPSSIGFGETGFAVGQNQCYITPPSKNGYKYVLAHELGHNLELKHIWNDLETNKDAIDNNNIMGYDGGNSFWIWQKDNIRDKNND